MIKAGGEFAGQAAATFGDITPGTNGWCDGYQRVTVTGKSPETGYVFAHRLEDGAIIQLPSANRPGVQYLGSYNHVKLTVDCPEDNIPTAVDTIGELTLGQFFDTGSGTTPPGKMGRKVQVYKPDGSTQIYPTLAINDEAIGNSGDTDYAGTAAHVGVTPGTFVMTSGDLEVTDDGNGNLGGDVDPEGTNTINYATGEYDVKFSEATASNVTADYTYTDTSKCWRLLFEGDTVEAVATSTTIESYGESVADSWVL